MVFILFWSASAGLCVSIQIFVTDGDSSNTQICKIFDAAKRIRVFLTEDVCGSVDISVQKSPVLRPVKAAMNPLARKRTPYSRLSCMLVYRPYQEGSPVMYNFLP